MPTIAFRLLMMVLVSIFIGHCTSAAEPVDLDRDLLAHWPLAGDAQDRSKLQRQTIVHGGVDWQTTGPAGKSATAANFNGRDAFLEVPASAAPQLGAGDFSLSAWVDSDVKSDDVPGDLISQYDARSRRGFHWTLKTNAGVTTTQANFRQLQFGIDNNRDSQWVDCGKPGNAILAFALAVHDGHLFAGTCEPGKDGSGHVYRYGGGTEWVDCGSPAPCNSVTALAVYDGKLYAGVGKYRLAGSALDESANANLGGRVFRYDGEMNWTDCGQLPDVEAIGGMVVFRGQLYASSLYRPAGFFRFEGGSKWTTLSTLGGKRVEALGAYNGFLYGTSYDEGHVYRFDGTSWTDCGQLGEATENTQTYSFAVHAGRLFVGTWRSGRVFRFEDLNRWTDAGRLGEELEVMGMLVHNGRLMAGTLPLAEVYSYDGDTTWRRMTRLDHTPEVRYRRAWTMAEFQGQVFCSTLPSGHVYSFEAGKSVAWDHEFPGGWHHVAAVKSAGQLSLYVDGRQVATSSPFQPGDFDLSSESPLRIGFGANDYFKGRLAEIRLYGRALNDAELAELSRKR